MQRRNNSLNTVNNPGNTGTQKENEESPEIKVMEDRDLNDRKFKIAVMKKLNKIQENSEN